MTTFGPEGTKITPQEPDAAQLVPPADYCAPDDDKDPAPDDGLVEVTRVLSEVDADNADVTVVEPDEAPGNAVALIERFDVTATDEVWKFDFLEFQGDKLGIRLPQRQALAAFSLASSKYVAMGVKNDLTGLFIARHLSPESYGRVFSRLMDPDDAAYTVDTVGELFNAIVTAAIDADDED
ncbi:tail assembly chaperone [Mycobacterium phage Vincenzo]|uniref:Tail assembly chaperone n=2 Tax=Coopervirus vincenzo TaxID=1983110 RepID=A0A0F6SJI7_9CAUD|nr:tail assembly chaperone [Mycobacterium phage Vincenzo]AKF14287.1 hypothetical protein SEA_VINCENZO_25 [Mycobacterium phage Vincenzo]AKF14690.1 hypothetical protein SEA_ALANGRANT_25 [Mycobacterium phage AlanGrant]